MDFDSQNVICECGGIYESVGNQIICSECRVMPDIEAVGSDIYEPINMVRGRGRQNAMVYVSEYDKKKQIADNIRKQFELQKYKINEDVLSDVCDLVIFSTCGKSKRNGVLERLIVGAICIHMQMYLHMNIPEPIIMSFVSSGGVMKGVREVQKVILEHALIGEDKGYEAKYEIKNQANEIKKHTNLFLLRAGITDQKIGLFIYILANLAKSFYNEDEKLKRYCVTNTLNARLTASYYFYCRHTLQNKKIEECIKYGEIRAVETANTYVAFLQAQYDQIKTKICNKIGIQFFALDTTEMK